MTEKNVISRAAESLREDVTSFLREIISIPSFSGMESAVVERLEQEMNEEDIEGVNWQHLIGEEPEVSTWQFSTNGVATRGVFDIPTIGFGPGAEEHAHMPTDQVRVDDLVRAMEFYSAFVLKYQ